MSSSQASAFLDGETPPYQRVGSVPRPGVMDDLDSLGIMGVMDGLVKLGGVAVVCAAAAVRLLQGKVERER